MLINLKPRDERSAERQRRSSGGCSARPPTVAGHHALHAAGAGPDDRRPRSAARSTSSRSRTPNADELDDVGAAAGRAAAAAAAARRRRQRPAGPGPAGVSSTSTATPPARLGITAGDDRQRALRRVRPAHRLDDLHPVQPVPRDPRGRAATAARRRDSLDNLYVPRLGGGQPVPLSAIATRRASSRRRCRSTTSASSRRRPISFNLAPGASLGEAVDAIDAAAAARSACRASIATDFQGAALALPGVARQRAAADPGRGRHRLHRARRALRELHPPAHDPLDAAVGRRRRAAGADARRQRPRASSRIIGIILLIGIVKKNAIMMIDFALDAERNEGKSPREAIYQACLLRFRPILMTTHGGAARRAAADARHAAPARSCAIRSASRSSAA